MRGLALPCLLLSLLTAPTRAQEPAGDDGPGVAPPAGPEVAVLSVGGDAPTGQAREAREAVAAALSAEGLRVLPEGDLSLRVPPSRLTGCDSARCAFELGRELGVPMVAAVATWQGADGPASLTVSLVVGPERAHAASEDVGEGGLPAAARRALRSAQRAQERALLVEGVGTRVEQDDEPETLRPDEELAPRDRSVEEYVLPTILGVVGLALAAGAVYALLPEQCDVVGELSGVCLRGNAPNIGLGVVMAVTGGLSIAGSILWLVVGGSPPNMGSIDVVVGPDGGGLGWSGRF